MMHLSMTCKALRVVADPKVIAASLCHQHGAAEAAEIAHHAFVPMLDVFEHILERVYTHEFTPTDELAVMGLSQYAAAFAGNLEYLDKFACGGSGFTAGALEGAAAGGHFHVYEHVRPNLHPSDLADAADSAVRHDLPELLSLILTDPRNEGTEFDRAGLLLTAADSGAFRCAQILFDGIPDKARHAFDVAVAAAGAGLPDMMVIYLGKSPAHWIYNWRLYYIAARHDRDNVLEHLDRSEWCADSCVNACYTAVENGSRKAFDYVVAKHVGWKNIADDLLLAAMNTKHHQFADDLIPHACRERTFISACFLAARAKNEVLALRCLRQHRRLFGDRVKHLKEIITEFECISTEFACPSLAEMALIFVSLAPALLPWLKRILRDDRNGTLLKALPFAIEYVKRESIPQRFPKQALASLLRFQRQLQQAVNTQ
jgi:hypothetical protein